MFSYKFYPNLENFTPSRMVWMVTFSKSAFNLPLSPLFILSPTPTHPPITNPLFSGPGFVKLMRTWRLLIKQDEEVTYGASVFTPDSDFLLVLLLLLYIILILLLLLLQNSLLLLLYLQILMLCFLFLSLLLYLSCVQ